MIVKIRNSLTISHCQAVFRSFQESRPKFLIALMQADISRDIFHYFFLTVAEHDPYVIEYPFGLLGSAVLQLLKADLEGRRMKGEYTSKDSGPEKILFFL